MTAKLSAHGVTEGEQIVAVNGCNRLVGTVILVDREGITLHPETFSYTIKLRASDWMFSSVVTPDEEIPLDGVPFLDLILGFVMEGVSLLVEEADAHIKTAATLIDGLKNNPEIQYLLRKIKDKS